MLEARIDKANLTLIKGLVKAYHEKTGEYPVLSDASMFKNYADTFLIIKKDEDTRTVTLSLTTDDPDDQNRIHPV